MNLHISLTPDRAAQLAYLQQQNQQDATTIIQNAIVREYEQAQSDCPNAFQLFEDAGLIGCIDGPADLSTHYKPLVNH